MRSRLILAVAAAAALSSALSVALTQSLGAQAATGSTQPSSTQLQERTNTLLADIDHKLGGVSRELVSVQNKQVFANDLFAKTYQYLFKTPTWLNLGVSRYGYLGRLQAGLLAMCHLQAVEAHNFDYCTDRVSGKKPNP